MEIFFSRYVDVRVTLIYAIIIILSVYLLFNIVRWYLDKRRNLKKLENIRVPPAIPILGHVLWFIGSPSKIFEKMVNLCFSYGPNFLVKFLDQRIVFVGKPEDLEIVMMSKSCLDKHEFYRFVNIVSGTGIFTAPAAKWHRNRKLLNPAFNRKALEIFFPIFRSCASIFVNEIAPKYLGKRKTYWYVILAKLNSDAAMQTIAGIDCDIQRKPIKITERLLMCLKVIFIRMCNFHYHLDFLFFRSVIGKNLLVAKDEVHNYMGKIIKEKKSEFDDMNNEKLKFSRNNESNEFIFENSILKFLLELDHRGTKFDQDDLRNEVVTLYGAAVDTTAATTGFFLTMMGMYPDIQDRVYEEITDVIDSDRVPTLEDINKLSYMERCLKETLRLFPAAPLFLRQNTGGDLEISDGIIIPKGDSICISPFYMHRSELYWEDPLRFDPDRFLPDQVAKRHPYSFIPFSGGLRSCIGQRYAYFSLKTTISHIISKYRVHCDAFKSIEEMKLKIELILKPGNDFEFWLEKRPSSL